MSTQCSNKTKDESKREYSVTITPDIEGEKFTHSDCNCDICKSMHIAQVEWDTFTPKTKLQFRMKEVINKLDLPKNKKKAKDKAKKKAKDKAILDSNK